MNKNLKGDKITKIQNILVLHQGSDTNDSY